jgi:DNA-binding GntR family transcriptional regulator
VIARYLTGAIESGAYRLGDPLPSEAELCAEFQASRFTVREALRHIEELGLISRRHGSGRRVIATRREPRYALRRRSDTDLLRYTEHTTLEILTAPCTPTTAVSQLLALGDPEQWVWVSAVRRAAGSKPIAHLDLYVLAHLAPVLADAQGKIERAIFTKLAEYGQLELSHVDEVVSATTMSDRAAEAVTADAGGVALQIIRRFSAYDTGLYEVSVNLHPADRFEYALRFDRIPEHL